MILGGIPYYLSLLDPSQSYHENIDALLFKKKGELWDEFSSLYHTLFTNSEHYIKVVETLHHLRRGMTRGEIAKATKLALNGALSQILNNLADSGFIRQYICYRHGKKETLYQLADYYTLFYFRFIKDRYGKDEHFWSRTTDNPARRVWAGLSFEQLCMDHITQIKKKLGVEGVLSEEYAWSARDNKESSPEDNGAQIDLLIDRRDRVINVCEIKFSINEFEIDKTYDRILRNKIETYRKSSGTKKTLQLTMITTFGVKSNMYSSIATGQVVLDDLFV